MQEIVPLIENLIQIWCHIFKLFWFPLIPEQNTQKTWLRKYSLHQNISKNVRPVIGRAYIIQAKEIVHSFFYPILKIGIFFLIDRYLNTPCVLACMRNMSRDLQFGAVLIKCKTHLSFDTLPMMEHSKKSKYLVLLKYSSVALESIIQFRINRDN